MARIVGLSIAIALTAAGVAVAQDGADEDGRSESDDGFSSFSDVMAAFLELRCRTALCFGGESNHAWAIEPIVEMPFGKTFAVEGDGLDSFINSQGLSVQFSFGLRFWLFDDLFSLAVYGSVPMFETDETIRITDSEYEHPASRVSRPYPGIALGLAGDTIWIGFDIDELRNGPSDEDRDVYFPRNEVIDRVLTITIGVAPVSALKLGIGTMTSRRYREARRPTQPPAARPAIPTAVAAGSGPGPRRAPPSPAAAPALEAAPATAPTAPAAPAAPTAPVDPADGDAAPTAGPAPEAPADPT